MYVPIFTITPKILKNFEEIGKVFGYIKAIKLPTQFELDYIAKIKSEMVHASTAIEGNTLTQDQVNKVIAGHEVKAIQKDIIEVKNYFDMLTDIRNLAGNTETWNESTILQLHYQILNGLDDKIAGHYRSGEVRVGNYFPPQATQVPRLMKEFIEWLNYPVPQELSPIIYAGISHYKLVAIHPFFDGNGRTTRALTTLYLIKNKYDITQSFALESYYNRERKNYYQALDSVDHNGDLTSWLEYFTEGFLVEALHAQSIISEYLSKSGLIRAVSLTPTQRQILDITTKLGTATMSDYLKNIPLTRRGISKSLQKLVANNILSQSGALKGTYYRVK